MLKLKHWFWKERTHHHHRHTLHNFCPGNWPSRQLTQTFLQGNSAHCTDSADLAGAARAACRDTETTLRSRTMKSSALPFAAGSLREQKHVFAFPPLFCLICTRSRLLTYLRRWRISHSAYLPRVPFARSGGSRWKRSEREERRGAPGRVQVPPLTVQAYRLFHITVTLSAPYCMYFAREPVASVASCH